MSDPTSRERCGACPVQPGSMCLGACYPKTFGYYCDWAREGDSLHLTVIVNRSAIGPGPETSKPRVPLGVRQSGHG